MTPLVAGLALAVGAAVALNAGYLLQHLGSASLPAVSILRPVATMRSLLRSRLWTLGCAAGLTGWALHVAALSNAPLSLVQAFVAGGLALTVPLSAWILRRPAGPGTAAAVAVMALALALLAIGSGGAGSGSGASWAPVAFVGGSVALALLLAVIPSVLGRANSLALAAGVLYGAADVAIKGLTSVAAHGGGVAGVLLSPWMAAAALTTCGAFFCFQRGLQCGSAISVIALTAAGTNLISIVGGFAVFGESLGATTALIAMHAVAFVLTLVAAWRLAVAQAALLEDPEEPPARLSEPERNDTDAPPAVSPGVGSSHSFA